MDLYDDSIIDSIAIGKPVQCFEKIPVELFVQLREFLQLYTNSIHCLTNVVKSLKSKEMSKFFGKKSSKSLVNLGISEKCVETFQQIDSNFLKSVDYFEIQSFSKFQDLVEICEKFPKDLNFLNYLAASNTNPLHTDIVLECLYKWDDYFLELGLPSLLQDFFENIYFLLDAYLLPILKGDLKRIDMEKANNIYSSMDVVFSEILESSKKYVEKTPFYFKSVWKVSRFKKICNGFF